METDTSIAGRFGKNLALLLADKISAVDRSFEKKAFVRAVANGCEGRTYTERVNLLADSLGLFLPKDYEKALPILTAVLGEENPHETGMFTHFYWILPLGKYVEKFGLDHFDLSMDAIAEITKRNTGEYAVRPFIRKYPREALKRMRAWAKSPNFHLRRLASEGLRPKLPWAPKLDLFVDKPEPVFEILELLKEDEVRFVKRSVANHLTDWLKVNPGAGQGLVDAWRRSENAHTQWMVRHATRKPLRVKTVTP